MESKTRLTDLLRERIDKYFHSNYFNPSRWQHENYTVVNDNIVKGQLVYNHKEEGLNYTTWCIKDDDGWYELSAGFCCHYHPNHLVSPRVVDLVDFFRILYRNGAALDMFLFNERDYVRQAAAEVLNEKE